MATKGKTASQAQRSYKKLNQETNKSTYNGTGKKNTGGFYHIMKYPI
jgi:hypothetical protein